MGAWGSGAVERRTARHDWFANLEKPPVILNRARATWGPRRNQNRPLGWLLCAYASGGGSAPSDWAWSGLVKRSGRKS
jgi:hypothetical protein